MATRSSLVVVLPTLPVIATTRGRWRRRTPRASSENAHVRVAYAARTGGGASIRGGCATGPTIGCDEASRCRLQESARREARWSPRRPPRARRGRRDAGTILVGWLAGSLDEADDEPQISLLHDLELQHARPRLEHQLHHEGGG